MEAAHYISPKEITHASEKRHEFHHTSTNRILEKPTASKLAVQVTRLEIMNFFNKFNSRELKIYGHPNKCLQILKSQRNLIIPMKTEKTEESLQSTKSEDVRLTL